MIYKSTQPLALTLIASASLLALTCPAQAEQISETRDLAAFSEISSLGSTDVEVTVGSSQSVTVFAEADEIGEIITEVKGDRLIVKRKANKEKRGFFNRTHSARVVVTMPKLTDFDSKGSGDADISGLSGDHFELGQYGSGDVNLSGSVKKAGLRSDGSGDLEGDNFSAEMLSINAHGSGDLSFGNLSVSEFTYKSHGSGDLDAGGSCTAFTINTMGSGEIDADGLQCKDVSVSSKGSGEISIFASGDVSVSIFGSGDVDIYGGGNLVKSKTFGSGDVEIRN